MPVSELWREPAEALRAVLLDKGVLDSPELEAAYWRIPRHRFIDLMYEYEPATFSWAPRQAPDDPELDPDWLARLYRNETIVTRLDEMGMPTSGNSTPSLVFRMLAAAKVRPGQRVLEIGTGTGQLTATLSALVGPSGSVVTIDSDPTLVEEARSRLRRLLPGAAVELHTADARALDPGSGRFDLIISTASCWPVPAGWLALLAPGGVVCAELRRGIGGAVVLARAEQVHTGQPHRVAGELLSWHAALMPLRDAAGQGLTGIPFGFGEYEAKRAPADGLTSASLDVDDFRWFCQLELPEAGLIYYAIDPDTIPARFVIADGMLDAVQLPDADASDGELISYGDSASLLDRLQTAWDDWRRLGQPGKDEFSFTAEVDGEQFVVLRRGERAWRIRDEPATADTWIE